MGYDDDLNELEEGLRRLKIEYHIFFSGNRKKPPDDLKLRVEKLVKKLSESPDMSVSQRFRFTTLVTRFYVYRDLWRRTLLEKEMGTEPHGHAPAHPASSQSRKRDKTVRVSISDPAREQNKIRELYQALLDLQGSGKKKAALSYEQFSKYIATQTHSLRQKYGCVRVAFTLTVVDDAVRFTAAADKT